MVKICLKISEKEMRKIRGRKVSMIFQDPMTALNPIMKVGEQIAEVIKLHNDITWREANERAVKMLEMVGIPGDRFERIPPPVFRRHETARDHRHGAGLQPGTVAGG